MRQPRKEWWVRGPSAPVQPEEKNGKTWRGCFWRVDDELSSDDDEEQVGTRGRLPSCILTGMGGAGPRRPSPFMIVPGRHLIETRLAGRRGEKANIRLKKRRERMEKNRRTGHGRPFEPHWLVAIASLPFKASLKDLCRRSKEYVPSMSTGGTSTYRKMVFIHY